MERMTAYLRRVNTWTAIAILALTGWLVDSLLWFLESHPLSLAGLLTYLAHQERPTYARTPPQPTHGGFSSVRYGEYAVAVLHRSQRPETQRGKRRLP
jgi:hypothetical protein